ncbi:UDP-N-acetylmuramate dehydrogenase [Saxibacter everestensis]|uniref:UDP-N-acetylenolpyruvoylglucosamine reductase n=1 Tax=Saxibacter everestensis TaxID=2909229 RepID=A0ABY8QYJ7_9MICO|nr:UDP-N-acetylmuramate dehydrogenase [Brevibacteriaceae bacterium ZFBP1038]
MRLAELTTLRVGGPAESFVRAYTDERLIETISGHDDRGAAILLVAGGSNLLVSDQGFPGTVVQVATEGITAAPFGDSTSDRGSGQARDEAGSAVRVDAAAGVNWDEFVAHTVHNRLAGLEALSGIPGSVGATPIQNVGAYGAEVGNLIDSVRVWDRQTKTELRLGRADCEFGYRDSLFKRNRYDSFGGRHIVLGVTFILHSGDAGAPVRYAELARSLGVELGERAPIDQVREAVLRLRAGKGMVLDPDDPDTYSAGSFFTNPILPGATQLPEGAPAWPLPDGSVKTSAAWLIDHAGFSKGFGIAPDRASLSTKHPLALTNRGTARAADIVELARTVRAGVIERFGIELHAEPNLVGVSLLGA